jgi:predicted DNA-binding protein
MSASEKENELRETMTIRMPVGMRDELHKLAKANNRTLNGQVIEELSKAIKRFKTKKEGED